MYRNGASQRGGPVLSGQANENVGIIALVALLHAF